MYACQWFGEIHSKINNNHFVEQNWCGNFSSNNMRCTFLSKRKRKSIFCQKPLAHMKAFVQIIFVRLLWDFRKMDYLLFSFDRGKRQGEHTGEFSRIAQLDLTTSLKTFSTPRFFMAANRKEIISFSLMIEWMNEWMSEWTNDRGCMDYLLISLYIWEPMIFLLSHSYRNSFDTHHPY